MVQKEKKKKRMLFILLGVGAAAVAGIALFARGAKAQGSGGNYDITLSCPYATQGGRSGTVTIPSLNKTIFIPRTQPVVEKLPAGIHQFTGQFVYNSGGPGSTIGDIIVGKSNNNLGCPIEVGTPGNVHFHAGYLTKDVDVLIYDVNKKLRQQGKVRPRNPVVNTGYGFANSPPTDAVGFYSIPQLGITMRPFDASKNGFCVVVNE